MERKRKREKERKKKKRKRGEKGSKKLVDKIPPATHTWNLLRRRGGGKRNQTLVRIHSPVNIKYNTLLIMLMLC